MSESAQLYTRQLPGGGYVIIEQVPDGTGGYRAQLRVERRADPFRRDSQTAPVIAEATGNESQTAFDELRAIAASNVSLAHRILRWQAGKE